MKQTGSTRGFTLIEAIISAALLAMVIAGSYKILGQASRLMRTSRNHYIAINIGKNRLERARLLEYDQLTMLAETNILVDTSGLPSSAGDFRRSTILNTNVTPGLMMLTVNTEIRNTMTQAFTGEVESVSSLFTSYLTLH